MGIIDLLIVAVIALVTWCVAAEGAVGAGVTFLCVVFSGLLAMNFFEPVASALDGIPFLRDRSDMVALVGLFAALAGGSRLLCEHLSPTFIPLQGLAYDGGRWGFGFLTGYVVAAFLLTALHTTPFPREFLGFRPERTVAASPQAPAGGMLFGVVAPDRQWLNFVQYVTGHSLARVQYVESAGGPMPLVRRFDGRTLWHWDQTASKQGDKEPTDIVMPSFVIRYADRRGQLNGEQPVEAAPPTTAPAGPTGGPQF